MKGYKRYDKNTIHLPRQYLPQPHGRIYTKASGTRTRMRRKIFHCLRGNEHRRNLERQGQSGLSAGKSGIGKARDRVRRKTSRAKSDYDKYDYLICMDSQNVRALLRILGGDPQNKVRKLLDFTGRRGDIPDPWYSGRFDSAYRDISAGCEALLQILL